MKAVVMKPLCLVLVVSLFSVMNGKAVGHVITRDEKCHDTEKYIDDVDDDDVDDDDEYDGETNQPTTTNQNITHNGSCQSCEETPTCHKGFTMLASKKCYMFSIIKMTWQQAQAECQRACSTLAFPDNADENTVLATYLSTHFDGNQGWWLGGNDLVKPFQWVWAHSNAPLRYFDWAPGQPDKYLIVERCVQYFGDTWQWNDASCALPMPFVCQQLPP